MARRLCTMRSANKPSRVAIIGGGVAGLTCARTLQRLAPNADVVVYDTGVLSCFVLAYISLSCLVFCFSSLDLSCLILPRFVLSNLVLSSLLLFWLDLSCPVLSFYFYSICFDVVCIIQVSRPALSCLVLPSHDCFVLIDLS
jgi:hypothetical protein